MNHQKNTASILGLTTLSVLVLGIFPIASTTQPLSSRNAERYRVAQATSCREVDVNTALNVRQQPGGAVIGTLENAQNVSIVGEPQNGWVRIESPMNGYVSASYLTYCTSAASPQQPVTPTRATTGENERTSTVPGSNCREVIAPNVTIRSEPGGEAIGSLEENQTVYIANEGNDGWVPIERPVNGYVSSASLGYCS
jgi:uncharacterized protein YgiM (DUF1202 family)